jgi:adenosine deaminase
MRTAARSLEIAELAVRHRDDGVVGFDIAGAEKGYPPTQHLDAFQFVQRANFHTTIHAGEAFGLPSIWEAIQWCGAERLGHGVRVRDDIQVADDGTVTDFAEFIRDRRIPLEPARRPTCTPASRRPSQSTRSLLRLTSRHAQHRQPADVHCSMTSGMQAVDAPAGRSSISSGSINGMSAFTFTSACTSSTT